MKPLPENPDKAPFLFHESEANYNRLHLEKVPRPRPTRLEKIGADPHTRLFHANTFSKAMHCIPERGVHSLDMWLESTCNQSLDWPIDKRNTVRQAVTNLTKCLCRPVIKHAVGPFDHPLRLGPMCERHIDPNYVELAVDCPHISQTKNGYSRKIENGNFYKT